MWRVRAMHFYGETPIGGRSDKVWAAVVLRLGANFKYLSLWGATGGRINARAQDWGRAVDAERRFDKSVAEKFAEGYREIDWTEPRWGLRDEIQQLGVLGANPLRGDPQLARIVASEPALQDIVDPRPESRVDAARKAWQTRRANEASRRANKLLANVDLTVPPKPEPTPEPKPPRMRSVRPFLDLES